MTALVRLAFDDTQPIATITFDRPDALNALSIDMMQQFAEHVATLQAQQHLRVVILTGAGTRAFCSGGDLVELAERPSATDAQAMITLMGDALLALERLPVPVIAAVNGYALGGGSEIALACDLRVVDERARMGMVQINMALTPGWGAGQRLLRLVGYARAMEWLLRGHLMMAAEMRDLALVNQIVPEGEALAHALTLAREIAAQPPQVVRGIKALLQAGLNQSYDQAIMTERHLFPPLWAAQPHLDAVERFLQRQRERAAQKKSDD